MIEQNPARAGFFRCCASAAPIALGLAAFTSHAATLQVGAAAYGDAQPQSRLRLAHSTLISDGPRPARFLRAWTERLPPHTPVQAISNLSVGVFMPGATGFGAELVPRFEFALPVSTRPLPPPPRWSPDAFQP